MLKSCTLLPAMRKIIMWTWPSLYDSNNTLSRDQSFFINSKEWQTAHTPRGRPVGEDVWSIYDACGCWGWMWQKQSNKLKLLSASFFSFLNRYIVSYFFHNEWSTNFTLQKVLEQKKGQWNMYLLIYRRKAIYDYW